MQEEEEPNQHECVDNSPFYFREKQKNKKTKTRKVCVSVLLLRENAIAQQDTHNIL